jgi:multidrug efflux pump subunit AcrA (membrane-fusion protein)
MKKNILFLISLIVLSTLVLSACGAEQVPATEPVVDEVISTGDVIAEGRLEPVRATNLTFLARGVVEEVFVQAGDTVSEGDVLVRLSNAGAAEAQFLVAQNAYDTLLRNESGDRAKLWDVYMKAQIARAEAERDWEAVDVTAIEDRIVEIEGDIEDLRDDLQTAQEDFDKYKDLDKDNSKRKTAEDDLEAAQEDLNEKVRELEEETKLKTPTMPRLPPKPKPNISMRSASTDRMPINWQLPRQIWMPQRMRSPTTSLRLHSRVSWQM